MTQWLLRRSAARRWMPSGGAEWTLLEGATFNRAFHVLRLLMGGLGHGPRRRSAAERDAFPRACQECGAAEVRWSYLTPGPHGPGIGFCRSCIGSRGLRIGGWPLLRGQGPQTAAAGDAWRHLNHVDLAGTQTRHHLAEPCPPCRSGEAGSEHMCIWCPAVAQAWCDLQPRSGRSLVEALSRPEEDRDLLRALLHQVSFLHGAGGAMNWQRSAAWLVRAVRRRQERQGPTEEADSGDSEADAAEDLDCPVEAWGLPSGDCVQRQHRDPGRHPRCSAVPEAQRHAPQPGSHGLWRPVAHTNVPVGGLLGVHYAATSRATWTPPCRGWWPLPRAVLAHLANSAWVVSRCQHCRQWQAALIAVARVHRGDEITVRDNAHVLGGSGGAMDIECTFDGGAREVNGARVAGAGAILWGPPAASSHGPSSPCRLGPRADRGS